VLLAAHDNARRAPDAPRVMGILNVTPDSFSDGGLQADRGGSIEHGLELVAAGADLVDIGGESTRPGAVPISCAEEMDRVLPVVEALAREVDVPLSVDTTKAEVARAALDLGARMINDVSAGTLDPDMLPLAVERDAHVLWMHMQNTPPDMQDAPTYEDVVLEVTEHLRRRVAASLKAGLQAPRIAVDPGIGFGKRLKDNLELIRSLGELRSLGLPIVVGVSRKSFLGRISGRENPRARDIETLAAVCAAHALGADVHRVHDVAATRRALSVQLAITDRDQAGGSTPADAPLPVEAVR